MMDALMEKKIISQQLRLHSADVGMVYTIDHNRQCDPQLVGRESSLTNNYSHTLMWIPIEPPHWLSQAAERREKTWRQKKVKSHSSAPANPPPHSSPTAAACLRPQVIVKFKHLLWIKQKIVFRESYLVEPFATPTWTWTRGRRTMDV